MAVKKILSDFKLEEIPEIVEMIGKGRKQKEFEAGFEEDSYDEGEEEVREARDVPMFSRNEMIRAA